MPLRVNASHTRWHCNKTGELVQSNLLHILSHSFTPIYAFAHTGRDTFLVQTLRWVMAHMSGLIDIPQSSTSRDFPRQFSPATQSTNPCRSLLQRCKFTHMGFIKWHAPQAALQSQFDINVDLLFGHPVEAQLPPSLVQKTRLQLTLHNNTLPIVHCCSALFTDPCGSRNEHNRMFAHGPT